jgi:hypothetical protein
MAEDWGSESAANSPWEVNATYLSELYDTSLHACNEFISEFCHHVRILYGSTLAERVQYLSLDERNKRLIGILRQLGNDDLLSTLDGITLYRLMNVDLESLLGCIELDCSEAINLCTGGDGLDLREVCVSMEFIYGASWSLDFQNLVTCLTRTGQDLTEALRDILTNKHGLYYEWRRAVVSLEAELAALNLPRTDIWNLDSTSNADTDRKVSIFCFKPLALGNCD